MTKLSNREKKAFSSWITEVFVTFGCDPVTGAHIASSQRWSSDKRGSQRLNSPFLHLTHNAPRLSLKFCRTPTVSSCVWISVESNWKQSYGYGKFRWTNKVYWGQCEFLTFRCFPTSQGYFNLTFLSGYLSPWSTSNCYRNLFYLFLFCFSFLILVLWITNFVS